MSADPRTDLIFNGLTETTYDPYYSGKCVTPQPGCWAGRVSSDEAVVTADAFAHTLETGHETAVTRESSRHYRTATDG
jgi:hypothetical protein